MRSDHEKDAQSGSETEPLSRSFAVADGEDRVLRKLRDVVGSSERRGSPSSSASRSYDHCPQEDSQVTRRSDHFTSCSAAVFLTVNAALGAGLLNFPHAFNEAGGLLVSFCIQLILLLFITGSLFILTYCTAISGAESFQDVVEAFCGKTCQQICIFAVILYSYGACLTFIIIIGDQSDRVLASLYGSDFCHFWYMNRDFTMTAASVVFILPLCFSKKIDFLKYSSSCGVLIVGYLILLSFYEWLETDTRQVVVKTMPDKWTDTFFVLPVICFGYQCHLSWVPTYAGMRQRSVSLRLVSTITLSMIICVGAYSSISVFGLLTFGSDNIDSDLMKNYDASQWVILIGILALAAKTISTYPLLLYCARVAIDDLYTRFRGEPGSTSAAKRRRFTIVVVWFTSTLLVAIIVPDISVAIDVLGTLAINFIFIFPGICLMSAVLTKDPEVRLLKNRLHVAAATLYICLGTFLFGLTLTQAVIKDFLGHETGKRMSLCS